MVLLCRSDEQAVASYTTAFRCLTNHRVKLPLFRQFKTDSWLEVGKIKGPLFRKVLVFDVLRAVCKARLESVSESQLYRTMQCH